jgi:hypothetical protein
MSDARQFALDAPYCRIWDAAGTAIEREILWDVAANAIEDMGYHIDYYNWDRDDDAPASRAESGLVYPHVAGWRLHAVISFAIWRNGMAPNSGKFPRVDGFTELDLAALDDALKAGQDIEFYLHKPSVATAKDSAHVVQHTVTRSERGGGNWVHYLTLDFSGLNLSATRPAGL